MISHPLTKAQREVLVLAPFALADKVTSPLVTEISTRTHVWSAGRPAILEIDITTNIEGGNILTATHHQLFVGPNGGMSWNWWLAFGDMHSRTHRTGASKHFYWNCRDQDAWTRSGLWAEKCAAAQVAEYPEAEIAAAIAEDQQTRGVFGGA